MTMKVVFEKDTWKLLGAQIVGTEGVDKRLDVLATAMHAGMKANMLKDLDLAYAPPFSSAKDPVNMAGFMIENIRNGFDCYNFSGGYRFYASVIHEKQMSECTYPCGMEK